MFIEEYAWFVLDPVVPDSNTMMSNNKKGVQLLEELGILLCAVQFTARYINPKVFAHRHLVEGGPRRIISQSSSSSFVPPGPLPDVGFC